MNAVNTDNVRLPEDLTFNEAVVAYISWRLSKDDEERKVSLDAVLDDYIRLTKIDTVHIRSTVLSYLTKVSLKTRANKEVKWELQKLVRIGRGVRAEFQWVAC